MSSLCFLCVIFSVSFVILSCIVCLCLCVLCIMLSCITMYCIVYCVTWCVPAVIWEGGLSSAGSRSGPEIVVIQLNFHNNWNGSQVIVIRNSKWNNWNRSAVIVFLIILIFVIIYSTQIEKNNVNVARSRDVGMLQNSLSALWLSVTLSISSE